MSQDARVAAFHHLLLRLDGWLPDELIAEARGWLADGQFTDIADAVVFTALSNRVRLTEQDTGLLAETLREAGADPSPIDGIERRDAAEMPLYGYAPVGPQSLAEHGDRVAYALDLTGTYTGPGGPDRTDSLAATVVAGLPGVRALWRSWRYPKLRTAWPPAKRSYLVQVVAEDEAPVIEARLRADLLAAGEAAPLVQVFEDDAALPVQHRAAQGFAALLWTSGPCPEVRLARLFDPLELVTRDPLRIATQNPPVTTAPATSGFAADHPRLDGTERDRVLEYLRQGTPLLMTTTLMDDVLDPARVGTVPMSFRTDGEWIWSDGVGYYLDRYGLAPEEELLGHIRDRGQPPAPVGAAGLHRALVALQTPAEPAVEPA